MPGGSAGEVCRRLNGGKSWLFGSATASTVCCGALSSGQVQISVLGPVEVSVGGRPVAIGAGKPRALLALLALHEGTTVSTARLVEGLWGGAPPASAHKMVQLYVSQLRKALRRRRRRRDPHARARLRAAPRRRRPGRATLRAADHARASARGARAVARRPARRCRGRAVRRRRDPPPRGAAAARDRAGGGGDLAGGPPSRGRRRDRGAAPRTRCASACTPSGCSRSTARAARRTRSRPTATRARRSWRQIGVEPGPELRDLHEAILRQDPRSPRPARHRGAAAGAGRRHRARGPRGGARLAARALAARARRRRTVVVMQARGGSARPAWRGAGRARCTASARVLYASGAGAERRAPRSRARAPRGGRRSW